MSNLTLIRDFARQKLGADKSGHAFDHLERVARTAKYLAQKEGADLFQVQAAAYLHDVIDEKIVANSKEALIEVRDFLRGLDLEATIVDDLLYTIDNMSFAKTLTDQEVKLSLSGQIVQDADWLDAIGAIGITRAIYYGGRHGETIYDPKQPPRENLSYEDYRNLADETIINHFYEKLLKIKDQLNTSAAKNIATHRQNVMLNFLDEFKAEWRAER